MGRPYVLMPALGVLEVFLALGVVLGPAQRLLLLALAGHLTGTFLSFVMAPQLMFQHGNALLLTADGEFVLKNLVLISAALLLSGRGDSVTRSRTAAIPYPKAEAELS